MNLTDLVSVSGHEKIPPRSEEHEGKSAPSGAVGQSIAHVRVDDVTAWLLRVIHAIRERLENRIQLRIHRRLVVLNHMHALVDVAETLCKGLNQR